MEIQPNTTVRFLMNCPLESNYENTIYWDRTEQGRIEQTTYFISKTKPSIGDIVFTIDRNTYQRANKNTIRVKIPTDYLYDCNYMMFQNNRYNINKWFYAFITAVNYVNESVTEVEYEIDVMQTWWFDFKPNASFIVREHSATDARGDNLIPENLETGEYVPVYDAILNNLNENENNLAVVIAAPWRGVYDGSEQKWHFLNFLDQSGAVTSGCYSALHYTVVYDKDRDRMAWLVNKLLKDGTGVIEHEDDGGESTLTASGDDLDQNLLRISPLAGISKVYYGDPMTEGYTSFEQTREFVNPVQSIVSIYMCDVNFTPAPEGVHPERGKVEDYSFSSNTIIRPFKNRNGTASYTPRNKKLYTAPFYFTTLSNRQGTEIQYPLEYFNINDGITFEACGDGSPNPSIMFYPLNYKGIPKNKEESITMTGYPICAWLTDTYKEWLAMNENMMALNKASAITSALTGVAGSVVSAVGSGGDPLALAGAGLGAIGNIAQGAFGVAKIMETKRQHSITPLQAKGSIGNTLLAANRMTHALFRVYGITSEYASNIDSYFDLYGYATQRVKKPNEKVRHYWTYTKTMNATLDGSLPADDEKKICSIYDNGIRFWNSKVNGTTINGGDYISKYDEYKAANTPI